MDGHKARNKQTDNNAEKNVKINDCRLTEEQQKQMNKRFTQRTKVTNIIHKMTDLTRDYVLINELTVEMVNSSGVQYGRRKRYGDQL